MGLMPTNVYPGGGARGQAQAVAGLWHGLGVQVVMLSRWQPHNRLSGFRPESCMALPAGPEKRTAIEGDGDPGAGRDGTAPRRRVTATPSECGLELR